MYVQKTQEGHRERSLSILTINFSKLYWGSCKSKKQRIAQTELQFSAQSTLLFQEAA